MSPRVLAWRVLRRVHDEGAYANLELPRELRASRLANADRAFVTELVYGTLRLQGRYDGVISLAAQREPSEIDQGVLDVLRLGCHQFLELDTPAHATVNEAVALAKKVGAGRAAGFVNAVMRRVSERPRQAWLDAIIDGVSDPLERLAIFSSHPTWIVKELSAALAADGRNDELPELLETNNTPPGVTLVDLRRISDPDCPPLPGMSPDRRTPLSASWTQGDPGVVVRQSNGLVRVQDAGSQLAALMLATARPISPEERWLDLCAGPGGKSAVLAALGHAHGVSLCANEPTKHRLDLVRQACDPFDNVTFLHGDGRSLDPRQGPFDRILLDAPCSGLGALRRRPESRWRKSSQDMDDLEKLQQELFMAASTYLAPGGLLAYVTCTPTLGETRKLISRVQPAARGLSVVPVGPLLKILSPELKIDQVHDVVQLWPHVHGTDAMFLSLFRRDE